MNKTRTVTFLMANLGSEMSQLFSFVEKGEREMAQLATQRAEKIIDDLFVHPDLEGRTGEVKILKDIVSDILSPKRRFIIKKSEIEEYFLPFSLRVTAS